MIQNQRMQLSSVIGDLPPEAQYVLLAMACFWVSTKVLHAGSGHLFALYVAAGIIYYLQTTRTTETLDFNQQTKFKYEVLGAPEFFHYDTNLIELFYNIYPWRAVDAYSYDHAIKATNNVLSVEADSEKPLQRCVDNYEIARDQAKIALNLLHTFVHKLDHPLLVEKLKNVLSRLQLLLERHLDKILQNCRSHEDKKETVDVNTRFVEDDKNVKPFDPDFEVHYDMY